MGAGQLVKLKSYLTSCFARLLIVTFLLVTVIIVMAPYAVEYVDGVKEWGLRAYRWKVNLGEYLRRR